MNKQIIAGIIVICLNLFSCQNQQEEKARKLAQELTIIDTHIDAPYKLKKEWRDLSKKAEARNFDYPRAKAGGLDVAFMSIYIDPKYQETGHAKEVADTLMDLVEKLAQNHSDKYEIVTSTKEVREKEDNNKVLLAYGMENGAGIEGKLQNLKHFYERGIRYITLAHSEWNKISDSSYDEDRKWHGLSPFGRKVVKAMNQLGIMIDVSHITDSAFYEVLEITKAPVIATHSSCRHFTPGFERNMSDQMIKDLAENGGVIQINFGSAFISTDFYNKYRALKDSIKTYRKENNLAEDHPKVKQYKKQLRASTEFKKATVGEVVDHIDHVVDLVGIEHVGLGSDFDGVGPTLPIGLEDASKFPNLIAELLDRGYTKAEIKKITSGNMLRVWRKAEQVGNQIPNVFLKANSDTTRRAKKDTIRKAVSSS